MNRRAVLGGLGALSVLGAGGALLIKKGSGNCGAGTRLTAHDLEEAVDLGGRYLVASMKPEGDFVYEVDWTTGKESRENNVVRQAGATWGLALLHRELAAEPPPVLAAALDKSLTFWRTNRRSDDVGKSWLAYRSDKAGEMGTILLVGLSLIDRLVAPTGLSEETKEDWKGWLVGLLAYVRSARLPDGGFADAYDIISGKTKPHTNPYVEGEALLLFVRAGLELGMEDCLTDALAWAQVDYDRNVTRARVQDPDSDTTKGYYQWGSMSWYHLAVAGKEPARHGGWLIELAHWMVDVHRTLERTKNTAYAYEGLLSAFDWARRSSDAVAADKFACVAHQGLSKLFSWQLGHPLALASLQSAPEQFAGGVQNAADNPVLRIDVTQHQLHAAMMAKAFKLNES